MRPIAVVNLSQFDLVHAVQFYFLCLFILSSHLHQDLRSVFFLEYSLPKSCISFSLITYVPMLGNFIILHLFTTIELYLLMSLYVIASVCSLLGVEIPRYSD